MMKRITLGILIGVSLCSMIQAADFYVVSNGNDANPGTVEKPFATLERARDAVRESKDRGSKPVTVHIAPGRYALTKTVSFGPQDSGTKRAPVVYRAESPGVIFDGGVLIDPKQVKPVTDEAIKARFAPESGGRIVQIDLKALGITNYGTLGPRGFARPYRLAPLELFIDSKEMTIARYPNAGEKKIPLQGVIDGGSVPRKLDFSMKPAIFSYVTPRGDRWGSARDMYVSGFFENGYADDMIPVAKVDVQAKTITTKLPHQYGFLEGGRGLQKWFALNLIEEIDLPSEYCVDSGTGILYFIPPEGVDMSKALIQVSLLEEVMVALEGASHIQFERLTFENSRATAAYIEEGEEVLFKGCTFRNLGMLALQMGVGSTMQPDGKCTSVGDLAPGLEWKEASRQMGSWNEHLYANNAWNRRAGKGHGVVSCDIYQTGAGGVLLGGGDRKTLTPAGNVVSNCDIHDVNRMDIGYRAAINVDGVGNRIVNNHLHHCKSQGIYAHGNDHVIEFNEIDHVLLDHSDQGAIYTGRNPSESGSVIRHNFIHDVQNYHSGGHGVHALYHDDFCTGFAKVEGNVFVRIGGSVVEVNRGGGEPFINNVMVDCGTALAVNQGLTGSSSRLRSFMNGGYIPGLGGSVPGIGKKRCFEEVNVLEPPYSTKYPHLKAILMLGRDADVIFSFQFNYEVKKDESQFVDPAHLNYALKPDSKVFKEIRDFKPIPFEKIGLVEDEYRQKK